MGTVRDDPLRIPESLVGGSQIRQHPCVLIAEINVPIHLVAEFTRPEVPKGSERHSRVFHSAQERSESCVPIFKIVTRGAELSDEYRLPFFLGDLLERK